MQKVITKVLSGRLFWTTASFFLLIVGGCCVNGEEGCGFGYVLQMDVILGKTGKGRKDDKVIIWLNDNPVKVWNVFDKGSLSMIINAWLKSRTNKLRIVGNVGGKMKIKIIEWSVEGAKRRVLVDKEVFNGEEVKFLTRYKRDPVIFDRGNEIVGLSDRKIEEEVKGFVMKLYNDLLEHRVGFYMQRRKKTAKWLRKFSPFRIDPFVEGEKINRQLFFDDSVEVAMPDLRRLKVIRGKNLVYVYYCGDGKKGQGKGEETYLLQYKSSKGKGEFPPLVLARIYGEWIPWGF